MFYNKNYYEVKTNITMTTKKKKNPKYKAPYKSTNYLESGDTSSNLPKFWGGSFVNQEGLLQNLTDLSEKGNPAPNSLTPRTGQVQDINSQKESLTPQYESDLPQNQNKSFMDNFQQKGVYGAVGKASSGYFANKASQSNDVADREYNTGMGLVSQAGPIGGVIGGITAIGDSIGDPIRKRVATTDNQGNVKSSNDFIGGNTIGSLTNPGKSMTETWNSNASTGQKLLETFTGGIASGLRRKKDVENAAKKQIADTNRLNAEKLGTEKALRDQEDFSMRGINRVNNMEMDSRYVNPSNQSFAEGGNMDYPGKGITEYHGERHENGGVTLGNVAEVEGGETRGIKGTPTADYIFSDRLKTLDNKTTFAMKSKNISNKYSLRPWDSISNNAKDRELQDLMSEHEVVKKASDLNEAITKYQKAKGGEMPNSDEDRVHNEMSMNDDVFAKGGNIHIKPENKGKFTAYKQRTGKTTEEALHSENPHVRQMANFARNAAKWHHANGGLLDNSHIYAGGGNLPMYPRGGIVPGVPTPITNDPYAVVNEKYGNDPSLKDLDYKDWLNSVETGNKTNYPNLIPAQELKDKAQLYYYSQNLNNKLREKNPEIYDNLQTQYGYKLDHPEDNLANKTRVTGAETYAKDNKDFYLTPDEQKTILGKDWDNYNILRGKYGKTLNLIGSNEDATKPDTWKVGARHAVAFNPSTYETVVLPMSAKVAEQKGYKSKRFKYSVTYNPNKEGDDKFDTKLDRYKQGLNDNEEKPYAYGGGLPKYAFGDDIANNSEYINAGTQGAIQLMRSNMINKLQPNKLDYTPISYLNESKYASPLSNVAFRPTRNDEEIQGLNTAYRGAEKASSEYADSGDYLNRMNAIDAAKSSNIGKAWEDHYNQEAQRRMQVDEFNKGIQGQNVNRLADIGMKNRDIEGMNVRNKMSTQEYGNVEKDALNNLKIQNYGDWSNYLTGATEGFAKRSALNDATTLEESKYPLYTFYRDENGRLKSKPRYPNNPELYKTNLNPKQ